MKRLFFGIIVLLVLGIGGLVYRNAVEHPYQKVACPVDAKLCPDGTSVSRVGPACSFPACPPPNVTLQAASIAFAIPSGFTAVTGSSDASIIAEYDLERATSSSATIFIRKYAIAASSTALTTIEQTAVSYPSGTLVSSDAFTSTVIGQHRYTVAAIERSNGTIDMAYYLSRGSDVLRFDAIDRNVLDWRNPNLNTSGLPAETGLQYLLSTLQGD